MHTFRAVQQGFLIPCETIRYVNGHVANSTSLRVQLGQAWESWKRWSWQYTNKQAVHVNGKKSFCVRVCFRDTVCVFTQCQTRGHRAVSPQVEHATVQYNENTICARQTKRVFVWDPAAGLPIQRLPWPSRAGPFRCSVSSLAHCGPLESPSLPASTDREWPHETPRELNGSYSQRRPFSTRRPSPQTHRLHVQARGFAPLCI